MRHKNAAILIMLLLAFSPKVIKAAGEPAMSLVYGEQKITLDQETVNSFKGQTKIRQSKIFVPTQETLKASLLRSFGKPQVKPEKIITYQYRLDKVYSYLKEAAKNIDVPVTQPRLTIKDNIATEFIQPQNGIKVDIYKSSLNLISALSSGRQSMDLPVYVTHPQTTLSDTNELGIKELVAKGESSFSGSPKNRIHNIEVGVERMKGIIVAPNEEFSFNKYLGPVDGKHGFLPELVIKKEGTIPEFGGGLCQVSSTVFRAAMQAGLPIRERRNHAYAVQYYAPQGTDATIYPGVVDLKFKNDTPSYLLIWPHFENKYKLIFELYGTKDSRQVILENPVQYDKKTDGSMKALWTRVVTKDGETSTSTFKSIYQPPALFHKEEKFVSTTTPTAIPPIPSQTN